MWTLVRNCQRDRYLFPSLHLCSSSGFGHLCGPRLEVQGASHLLPELSHTPCSSPSLPGPERHHITLIIMLTFALAHRAITCCIEQRPRSKADNRTARSPGFGERSRQRCQPEPDLRPGKQSQGRREVGVRWRSVLISPG